MNRLAVLFVLLSLTALCSSGCRKDGGTMGKPGENNSPCDKGD